MRCVNGNRYGRSILLWVLLLGVMIQTGCASVEHIRLYRDVRKDFSEAARADNIQTLKNIFPDPGTIKSSVNAQNKFNYDEARRSYEQWREVHAAFAALNSRAAGELEEDQLLGSSRAMEILAKLRRDLAAQILAAGGRPIPYPQAGSSKPQGPAPDPLTVSLEQAEKLLKAENNQLFARDEYILKSLRPTIRYEIAYVNKLRTATPSDKKERIRVLAPIVGQMAQAEEELSEVSKSCPASVKNYAVMSRFIMLVTARSIVNNDIKQPPLDANDPDYAKNADLQLLARRIHHFRTLTVSPGETPENDLMMNLGEQPKLSKLTEWGLGELFNKDLQP